MDHCIARIAEIVARGRDGRRDLLQLGYNLGRLSELTGLGREAFWDRWKDPVADWNLVKLGELVSDLQHEIAHSPSRPNLELTDESPDAIADRPSAS